MQGLVSWLVLVAAFAVVAAAGGIATARLCRFGVRNLRPPRGTAAAGATPRAPARPEPSLSESALSESALPESALPEPLP
jgi:hypothetical protein